ncbi:MAG: hypothetical protein KKA28_17470 [Planctomycetes bacterium]|nr:hypothetical protein [Planctomycetota bacterium]MCG2685052.1 hypothetical protein [Planctomycetales bacterium]
MLWEEKNRKAMEERQFCIPGTNDAFMVGLAEDTPPHLEKLDCGARWVLIHAKSGFRVAALNAIGQVSFMANWMYRRLPKDHWVWAETDAETVKMCLEPVLQQDINTKKDWSGYQDARRFEIEDEKAKLIQLIIDYGVSDHPDDEEPEDVRRMSKFQRDDNEARGYPRPGFGYEDCPNQDEDLLKLRLAYLKQKYMRD